MRSTFKEADIITQKIEIIIEKIIDCKNLDETGTNFRDAIIIEEED